MKVIAKKNRELALINAQNTQNENRAEIITLVVPEEYEDYNKKIVFITSVGNVWDVITNNEYKITNAITKYEKVDFYIWLTKEVDGESIDFRTKTKTLNFYHNEDASDEITPEEIHGVNTVVNLLEEEIEKVENLNIEATKIGSTTTVTITKKDGTTESVEINDGQDGADGYTPQKGIDYFTEQDIEEIENGVKNDLQETVLVDYSLITETGSKIELSINTTNYKLTAILKDKNNATICTSNEIDLPLETMVVNATYDNTTKKIILTLQNGTTVEFSVADLVSGLVSESQLQTILANYYTKTEINNLLANKVDKVAGKGLSTNDFTDEYKEQVDTNTEDIEDIQDEQTEQNTEIEKLQTENARFKATLPTTTGEGEDVTLDKTAEFEFIKPPLPMGNSEQEEIFYIETIIKKGFVDSEGNVRSDSNLAVMTDYIPVFPNTLYNINRSISTSYTNIRFFDKNKDFLGTDSTEGIMTSDKNNNRMLANETSLSMTILNNNVAFMVFNDYSNDLNTTYTISTLSPTPDYPQEITNVTGDVEVNVQNKNLLDISKAIIGQAWNTGSNNARAVVYMKCKPSTQYTISFNNISNFDGIYNFEKTSPEDTTAIVGVSQITTTKTITTNANSSYLGIQFNKSNISSSDFTGLKIQIEQNSTPTPYTPHKEQTFTFPLGNEKLMLGDYLADDGIHKNRKKIVLDGTSENKFSSFSTGANNRGAIAAFSDIKKGVDFRYNTALCTNFAYVPNVYFDSGDTEGFIVDSTGTIYVRFGSQSEINTLAKANQWLANTLPELEYELEEEVIVPYTSAQQEVYNQIKQAISYEEQTNISSNTIALFNVEAYQDAKVILAEKGTYSKPSTGIPKTDLASDVQTSLNKADTAIQEHQDISGKQDITDNTLTTINKTVPTAINEVNSIAKLANQAKSYSTYQAFINYLNTAEKTEFIPGQSFMIQTKLVPDLWVYSVENTSVQYTYTTDEDFITYTNQATGGQVGYYKLAQLETQKVDLTDYATKTYVNNLFNSIVDGDEVSY